MDGERRLVNPWNNGKEAEIQKMSPSSTTGRCSRHAAAVLSNKGVGTADQWERVTATRQPITRICSLGVVDRVYLQSGCGRTCEI